MHFLTKLAPDHDLERAQIYELYRNTSIFGPSRLDMYGIERYVLPMMGFALAKERLTFVALGATDVEAPALRYLGETHFSSSHVKIYGCNIRNIPRKEQEMYDDFKSGSYFDATFNSTWQSMRGIDYEEIDLVWMRGASLIVDVIPWRHMIQRASDHVTARGVIYIQLMGLDKPFLESLLAHANEFGFDLVYKGNIGVLQNNAYDWIWNSCAVLTKK